MKNKSKFHLEDFNFKIVELNVFSGKQEQMDNIITYYLLIDNDNLIHDYKIFFKQINIRSYTTASHKGQTKERLIYRLELIDNLKIKHFYQEEFNKRKEYQKFDFEQIKKLKINEWAYDKDWKKITFQNIQYILSGSNPKGEGDGLAYLKTIYKNNIYPFGFLLKGLNISEYMKKNYEQINYSQIWEIHKKNNFSNCEKFENWIDSNGIDKYLVLFKLDSHNWKIHKLNLEKEIKKNLIKFKKVDEMIRKKYRQDFAKNINEFYSSIKKEILVDFLYSKYFNIKNKSITSFDKAHIKPVWLIKKEYMENNDQKILEQISDQWNFLPLSKNIHWLYDNKYFYWNIDGKLIEIKNINEKEEMNKFLQISKEQLEKIKFYLKEYHQKIVKNMF